MELNSSREFRFTEQDFEKIRKMIYDYAGIALSPSKHDMVYGRLARRIRALNLSTFQQYLQIIEHGDSKEFINARGEKDQFDLARMHDGYRQSASRVWTWLVVQTLWRRVSRDGGHAAGVHTLPVLQRLRLVDVAQQVETRGDRCSRHVCRDRSGIGLHLRVVVYAARFVELPLLKRDVHFVG